MARPINKAKIARAGRTELVLHLADPRQLFVADPDFFFESATLVPGVEHLYEELRWRELDKPVRTTLHLPRRAIEPALQEKVGDAIRSYCTARRHRVENELRALLRDGL